jgi:hypothetical protein
VSAGTDGQDGPTDAAGAWVDGGTWNRGILAGIDPLKSLETFDTYAFFDKEGGIIRTGCHLSPTPSTSALHPLPLRSLPSDRRMLRTRVCWRGYLAAVTGISRESRRCQHVLWCTQNKARQCDTGRCDTSQLLLDDRWQVHVSEVVVS